MIGPEGGLLSDDLIREERNRGPRGPAVPIQSGLVDRAKAPGGGDPAGDTGRA